MGKRSGLDDAPSVGIESTRSQTRGAVNPAKDSVTSMRSVRTPIASTAASVQSIRPTESSAQLWVSCPDPGRRRFYTMLTARAATTARVSSETPAAAVIIAFARVDRGIVSVGLNAVAAVNATKR